MIVINEGVHLKYKMDEKLNHFTPSVGLTFLFLKG